MPNDRHPLTILHKSLMAARQAAQELYETGIWMKLPPLLLSFTDALKIHNEINGILDKTIDRIKIQNATRGGRF